MKRFIAIMLVLVMSLSVLVGCGPKKTDGHLTDLLNDLKDPNMEPVYSEEKGYWVAVPKE